MKKILFLTLVGFEDLKDCGIYHDLVNCLAGACVVYVVCPREKRTNLQTEYTDYGNIKVLKVATGNITQCGSVIEKGLTTLSLEYAYSKAIEKYIKNENFDLVLYSTPPVTFSKLIKYYKKKNNSKSYLMLKDIFPQNAVDLGFIKKDGFLHKYFCRKERQLYDVSDKIGCTSENNINYVSRMFPDISDKLVMCRNSLNPRPRETFENKDNFRDLMNLPKDAVIFLYGGNLGKPQAIDFLKGFIENFHLVNNSWLLIIGDGTEFDSVSSYVNECSRSNVILKRKIPRAQYASVLAACDVGLVFLDHRFTVPNNPARFTEYMEASLPMLAATDTATDTRRWLEEREIGYWVESLESNLQKFIKMANVLASDENKRLEMGRNGRIFFEELFTTRKSAEDILGLLDDDGRDVFQ